MADLKSFVCPACDAPITITGDAPVVKCTFCGNTVIVPPEMLHNKPELPPSLEQIAHLHVQEGEIPTHEVMTTWQAQEAEWQAADVEQKAAVEALRRARIQADQHPPQVYSGIREKLAAWHTNGYLSDADYESVQKMFQILE